MDKKGLEIMRNFISTIPNDKIKFDNFTMLEELSSTHIDQRAIEKFFKERNEQIANETIKTVKDL